MAFDPGSSISRETPVGGCPKVSIGMPVYNGEPFIRKALDCLLAQTFTDFELIISDNASPDRTPEICQEYAAKDARIRYIRQKENKGATWNFNFVLEQACAEYFMWAACDDLWSPDCLLKYVEVLDNDESVALVFCCCGVYNHYFNKYSCKINHILPSMFDNKINNLIVRFMNPIPNAIYGLFRKTFLLSKIRAIENIDFYDLYVTHVIAAYGKIYILLDPLYYAGIKNEIRDISSIRGSKITYWPFFIRNVCLIIRAYPLLAWMPLLILFGYFFSKLVLTTEKHIKDNKIIVETV